MTDIDIKYLNDLLIQATFKAWNDIENLKLGGFLIGRDFKPTGQLIGNLLHILIPKYMGELDSDFRIGITKEEKDIIWEKHKDFSIEIKTSSSKNGVYGNRSYNKSETHKSKNSYYLVINYKNFTDETKGCITCIRVGVIKKDDWKSQDSESGQQSYLKDKSILEELYKI